MKIPDSLRECGAEIIDWEPNEFEAAFDRAAAASGRASGCRGWSGWRVQLRTVSKSRRMREGNLSRALFSASLHIRWAFFGIRVTGTGTQGQMRPGGSIRVHQLQQSAQPPLAFG